MDKMSRTTKKLEKEKRELKSKADATDVRLDQQPHNCRLSVSDYATLVLVGLSTAVDLVGLTACAALCVHRLR